MSILKDLEPVRVFYYFEEICAIPHGSGNEKQLSDYIMAYASKHGLWAVQDSFWNVIIKKPGTQGYENSAPVILQGHIDMVCEKNNETVHDFENQGIELLIDGDFVCANGTTLGADNGLAAAYILALLESDEYAHPPIEAVFTTQEEVGMEGVLGLDMDALDGKLLINLDSEEEEHLFVSCAGGMRAHVRIPVTRVPARSNQKFYELVVTGLNGGHSGMDIIIGLGNANKILARVLNSLLQKGIALELAEISGGGKDNAIPREAKAVIGITEGDEAKARALITEYEAAIRFELRKVDEGLCIQLEAAQWTDAVFETELCRKIVNAIMLIPNGVQTMSADIPNLPESSTNLGVVKTGQDEVVIINAIRSSVESKKRYIFEQLCVIADIFGAAVDTFGEYPGWAYDPGSKLRLICQKVHEEMYGHKATEVAVHAGLECGVFTSKIKGIDIVSFGSDIFGAHTPTERMSIASAKSIWEYLLSVLRELK